MPAIPSWAGRTFDRCPSRASRSGRIPSPPPRGSSARFRSRTRWPRCSCAAAWPIRPPRGRGCEPPRRTTRRRLRAWTTPSPWSSATCAPARASSSTATMTSTGSARPRCSCGRCGAWAPTWAGTCRAGARTATGSRCAPWSAWRATVPGFSSPSTAPSPRCPRLRRPAPPASTCSSPTTTRRAPTVRCLMRQSSTRRCAPTRARSFAPPAWPTSSPRRCWACRRPRTSISSPWRRWPTSCRCAARTAVSSARACGRWPPPPSRGCARSCGWRRPTRAR